jgi:hypothetical protein
MNWSNLHVDAQEVTVPTSVQDEANTTLHSLEHISPTTQPVSSSTLSNPTSTVQPSILSVIVTHILVPSETPHITSTMPDSSTQSVNQIPFVSLLFTFMIVALFAMTVMFVV